MTRVATSKLNLLELCVSGAPQVGMSKNTSWRLSTTDKIQPMDQAVQVDTRSPILINQHIFIRVFGAAEAVNVRQLPPPRGTDKLVESNRWAFRPIITTSVIENSQPNKIAINDQQLSKYNTMARIMDFVPSSLAEVIQENRVGNSYLGLRHKLPGGGGTERA